MNPDLIALPFYLSRVLYKVYGLMRLEPGLLIIEYQTVENVIGLGRGSMRKLAIPLREIAEASLSKGPFGSRQLCLRVLYLHSLRKFPGAYDGVCQLRVRRAHALLAEDFVSRLELLLSEEVLRQLENPGGSAYHQLPEGETKIEHLQKVWEGIKGLLK